MSALDHPIVGIPSDVKIVGLNPYHCVGEKYINAVAHGADCCPFILPAYGPGVDLSEHDIEAVFEQFFHHMHGLFLAGSPSNIEPHHYSDEESLTPEFHDPQRDYLTLRLIRECVKRKLPVLAVCRGVQELNVALGGSLYQKVHEVDGYMDHREDGTLDRDGQYADTHKVQFVEGGFFQQLMNGESEAMVNSLHGQGLRNLGQGLVAEAHAPDGLVEAIRLDSSEQFVVGVQWHPEWQYEKKAVSVALFKAFGDAVRAHARGD